MSTSVLLSIKPKFADAILKGTKIFELRRAIFRNQNVRRIVIYASHPVCRVVGRCAIEAVLALEPQKLWSLTAGGAGVDREFFDDYFRGRSKASRSRSPALIDTPNPKDFKNIVGSLGLRSPSVTLLSRWADKRGVTSNFRSHRRTSSGAVLATCLPVNRSVGRLTCGKASIRGNP